VIISDCCGTFTARTLNRRRRRSLFYESLHALRELSRGGGVAVSATDTLMSTPCSPNCAVMPGRFIQL